MLESNTKHPGIALRWHERANLPLPRGGYIAGVIDNKLVIAGGTYWDAGKKLWTDQVDLFDPSTNHWQRSTAMPMPRSDAAAASIGDALYVFGGGAYSDIRDDASVFRGGKWISLLSARLPEPRLFPLASSHEESIYLTCGLSKAGDYSTATNTLWFWNSHTPEAAWKELPAMPGPGRANHAQAIVGDRIYVFGGAATDGAGGVRNLDDVYCFDVRTHAWSQLPNLPIARRAWWAVPVEDKVLLLGGYTDDFATQVFQYDPGSKDVQEIAPMPHGLADAKFFRIQNSVVGAGGESGMKIRGPWTVQADLV